MNKGMVRCMLRLFHSFHKAERPKIISDRIRFQKSIFP